MYAPYQEYKPFRAYKKKTNYPNKATGSNAYSPNKSNQQQQQSSQQTQQQSSSPLLDLQSEQQEPSLIGPILNFFLHQLRPRHKSSDSLSFTAENEVIKSDYEYVDIPPPGENSSYAEAKRAEYVEKDLAKAEKFYKIAIEKNERVESAVKDLATVLHQQGRTEEACAFLEEHKHLCTANYQKFENLLSNLKKQIVPSGNYLNKSLILFNVQANFNQDHIHRLFKNDSRILEIQAVGDKEIERLASNYLGGDLPRITTKHACLLHFASNSAARKTMETLRHPDHYIFFWYNIHGELSGKADAIRRPKENNKDRFQKEDHHQSQYQSNTMNSNGNTHNPISQLQLQNKNSSTSNSSQGTVNQSMNQQQQFQQKQQMRSMASTQMQNSNSGMNIPTTSQQQQKQQPTSQFAPQAFEYKSSLNSLTQMQTPQNHAPTAQSQNFTARLLQSKIPVQTVDDEPPFIDNEETEEEEQIPTDGTTAVLANPSTNNNANTNNNNNNNASTNIESQLKKALGKKDKNAGWNNCVFPTLPKDSESPSFNTIRNKLLYDDSNGYDDLSNGGSYNESKFCVSQIEQGMFQQQQQQQQQQQHIQQQQQQQVNNTINNSNLQHHQHHQHAQQDELVNRMHQQQHSSQFQQQTQQSTQPNNNMNFIAQQFLQNSNLEPPKENLLAPSPLLAPTNSMISKSSQSSQNRGASPPLINEVHHKQHETKSEINNDPDYLQKLLSKLIVECGPEQKNNQAGKNNQQAAADDDILSTEISSMMMQQMHPQSRSKSDGGKQKSKSNPQTEEDQDDDNDFLEEIFSVKKVQSTDLRYTGGLDGSNQFYNQELLDVKEKKQQHNLRMEGLLTSSVPLKQ